MGDFKKNPKKPFEVRVPNKIRKRIAMHQKEDESILEKVTSPLLSMVKAIAKPKKKRGSMWSRFTDQVKKLLR